MTDLQKEGVLVCVCVLEACQAREKAQHAEDEFFMVKLFIFSKYCDKTEVYLYVIWSNTRSGRMDR